ncbi:MAG: hypothetical protein KDC98_24780 [Planctomycetes bacterium]|nr:hypothetical protein [Planctomycetota bacterium]
MSDAGRPAALGSALVRKVGFACAVAACVAMPALIAGAGIDRAPAEGELERLAAAHAGTMASAMAGRFELAMVTVAADWPEQPAAVMHLLATARLAQVLAVLALSMLLYLAMLLARGRLFALAACVGFAVLPAVMVQGHVLRPESAATVFAGLALVLLQCLMLVVQRRHARGALRRGIVLTLLAISSASAIGLAVGTLPTLGGVLHLPLVLAMLIAVQAGLRGCRVGLRRGFLRFPAHAVTGRLWPPAVAMLLSFVMALWCLHASLRAPADEVRATVLAVTMLPEQVVAAGALLTLAAIGAVAMLFRTGLRFGRRGRAGADLVLLVYCFTQLGGGLTARGGLDPLPTAPALAIVFGEGVLVVMGFCSWWLRRRRLTSTPPR